MLIEVCSAVFLVEEGDVCGAGVRRIRRAAGGAMVSQVGGAAGLELEGGARRRAVSGPTQRGRGEGSGGGAEAAAR